ncbi:hypothetical protein C1645_832097 [Glomus cerebriforme]|uniref:Uncharacterized protein n=1 Tax=Glomus cerebriforme TaxID=658196 RepID=A0A397SKA4_9GLOM|nr:hypothetical protein C1645_832097 [Glomus cerebriforme]
MSISSLAVKWITTNIAKSSIRFLRKVRSDTSSIDILGLNIEEYETMITTWRAAFNYTGSILCAKDQTKVFEMIELCQKREMWMGCVPYSAQKVPTSMLIDELQQIISSLKKAIYITVYAISAVLPGIPPMVISIIPSDQSEKKNDVFYENNTIIQHLAASDSNFIGLFFNGATHDRTWLSQLYSENPIYETDLHLNKLLDYYGFPLTFKQFEHSKKMCLSGTDYAHCIKKGRNMHTAGTRILPIGNYLMLAKHLWVLKNEYQSKSGLTTGTLDVKDKQANELAERFFFARVLKAFAWAAVIYFSAVHNHVKKFPAYKNSMIYGMPNQTRDDFIYLGCTLILLIRQFPKDYPNQPLCPWLFSTVFLEHIFGSARCIIEDFTTLDFLMMNEKIIQKITIEMKSNLCHPESGDGYNIKLSAANTKVSDVLSMFPDELEFHYSCRTVEKSMELILYTLEESVLPIDEVDKIFEIDLLDLTLLMENYRKRLQVRKSDMDNFVLLLDDEKPDLDDSDNANSQFNFFDSIIRAAKSKNLSPLKIMHLMAESRGRYE